MPEGAEVKRVADSLHSRLSGKWIQNIIIYPESRYYMKGPIPYLDEIQFPLFISRIFSRGKKILFECDDSEENRVTLVSALAMAGRWQYEKGKHSGIELKFSDFSCYFDDQRHFGTFYVCLNEEILKDVMKGVGPDFLTEEISFESYNDVLSNKYVQKKEICGFLLEQKYFSGIGNWVRAEVLYESRIAPNRIISTLSEEEKRKIHYFSIKILREAYQVRGLTIMNYIDPEGEYGTYEVKVYSKEKDPFGHDVVRNVFKDKRTMHWVPALQK